VRLKEAPSKKPLFQQNALDKVVSWFNPMAGQRRLQARATIAMANAWSGGSKSRRTLRGWSTPSGDADTDTLTDLPTLRERSRDLLRDNPVANGAVNVQVTSIVGTGLTLNAQIDRNQLQEMLGLTDDDADAWERKTEAEFALWSGQECDSERTLNFAGLQELALRSVLESGDVFVLTPMIARRPSPYQLRLQLVEADRVCNKDNGQDTATLTAGVEKDANGAPLQYHILKSHPGNMLGKSGEWQIVPAFGARTGRRNVLHLYHKRRPGQTRGVPCLAPVIEEIKQLGRYSEAEIQRAVVSTFFSVFVKSQTGLGIAPMETSSGTTTAADGKNYEMSSGAVLDLAPGEDVTFADPSAPNPNFDAFVQAMTGQIGMALEIPYEVLVKRFTSSYSASKAALLEAWRFFLCRRKWLADALCRPVYELFLDEAVARGRIIAPGYLSGDPLLRAAWLGAEWVGPARGDIDEVKQIEAAERRIALGISTRARETTAITGGDYDQVHAQQVKENKRRLADGLGEGTEAKGTKAEGTEALRDDDEQGKELVPDSE
jgi:lambda family phage portal protein